MTGNPTDTLARGDLASQLMAAEARVEELRAGIQRIIAIYNATEFFSVDDLHALVETQP